MFIFLLLLEKKCDGGKFLFFQVFHVITVLFVIKVISMIMQKAITGIDMPTYMLSTQCR